MGPAETGKDTNPKDAIGATKLPIGLVPSTGINLASVAFLEGATKYGRYNWRVAGVRTSIYYDAAMRHLEKYWNGEDVDGETGVPHLASALACIMIIEDARCAEKLEDDRPPRADVSAQIAELDRMAARVRDLFSSHSPKQWTIQDVTGPAREMVIPTDPGIRIVPWPTKLDPFPSMRFGKGGEHGDR